MLVVYSEGQAPKLAAQWVVPALLNLLGHFDCTNTVIPADAYQPGQIETCDVVIYLGLGPAKALPEALLSDIYGTNRPVCWLGYNLDLLAARFSLERYSFEVAREPAGGKHPRVIYRSQVLTRPQMPMARITVTHRASCIVLAAAEGEGQALPYAVRSGRFWYFADVPLMELSETGSHVALSDQLHEILGQPHPARRTALICITGVSAQTDLGGLRALVRYLQGEKLPYAIAVIPLFRDPREDLEVRLSSRRSVVGIVRGAQRAGAATIANGFTHQFGSRSGEDAEFWDLARNRPPLGHTPSDTVQRIRQAIAELGRCGLYPTVWATPQGRASSADYAEIARACSTTWERRLTSVLAPGPQTFPFLVKRDSFGQRVIPDNLSVLRGGGGELETILEQARCQSVVPDPWLTAAIAPEAPLESVKLLIAALREMGYQFADLRRDTGWMKGRSLEIYSTGAPTPITRLMPSGWDATLLGPSRRDLTRFESPDSDERDSAVLRPGAILITYPSGGRPREIFAFEGGPEEMAQRAVAGVARVIVIFALGACVLFILIYLTQISLQWRA